MSIKPIAYATATVSLIAAPFLTPASSVASPYYEMMGCGSMDKAYVHYLDKMSSSTCSPVVTENSSLFPRVINAKHAAFDMFGQMRGSTAREQALYEKMLSKISSPIDVDIFAL